MRRLFRTIALHSARVLGVLASNFVAAWIFVGIVWVGGRGLDLVFGAVEGAPDVELYRGLWLALFVGLLANDIFRGRFG